MIRAVLQGMSSGAGIAATFACALVLAAPAQAEISEPHVPGEVIVQFERGTGGAEREAARDDAGTETAEGLGSPGLQLVEVTDDGSVERTIRELEADPAVRFAEPNFVDQLSAIPEDPEFPLLWGMQNTGQTVNGSAGVPDADIDAPEAWDIERGSATTVIAVMDSGIDTTHPDLGPNLWENTDEVGGNGVDDDGNGFVDDVRGFDFTGGEDGNPFDAVGHGTHVSGTVAGVGGNGIGVAGVSQRAQIMSLRVCGVSGCTAADQIQAINYAAANGARVLNASLGGFSNDESLARRAAIFSSQDVLHVFAAGNDGANADGAAGECSDSGTDPDPCRSYPCAHAAQGTETENVICVAATTQSDARASFSNFGATSVDLGAPGTNVRSANAERQYFTDTFTASDFATRWNPNGADTNWIRTNEAPLTSFGITDSPAANYASGVNYGTITDPIGVAAVAERGCFVRVIRDVKLIGTNDTFRVGLRHTGAEVGEDAITSASNTPPNSFASRTSEFATPVGAGNLEIRLRLLSAVDGTQADGIHVDRVDMECGETPGPHDYDFKNGTSMASPYVAGAAGLLISRNPAASTSEIRQKLLSTVDPNGGMFGVTTTGGRLNVGRAVGQMPADTSITSGPGEGEEIATNTPSFGFSSNDPSATFQCSIDGGLFSPCASGGTVGPATPGAHALAVRSVDPRGNPDTTPATRAFAVESIDPRTTIAKGPKRRTKKRKATFAFGSDEPGSTFECKIDRKPFVDCASPRRLKKVKPGKHVFLVRATDPAGNVDETADRHRWRVKPRR
jgi:subtilisin family serine protease